MKYSTADLTKMAMMAALVCLLTFTVKIPVPATGGYTHLGDCMIFIGVLILGWRKAVPAAALGAALADLFSGAALWIVPTFIIKGVMALIMGVLSERYLTSYRLGWLLGAVVGGCIQIIGYTVVKMIFFNLPVALATIPNIVMQTTAAIMITVVIVMALTKTAAGKQLFNLGVNNDKTE